MKNIHYSSDYLLKFFKNYRNKWSEFYPSEKWAFGQIGRLGKVLDCGCATGGLGMALGNRMDKYHGIDINPHTIRYAKQQNFGVPVKFKCGDILTVKGFKKGSYDTVVSLSCVDWNIETPKMIDQCWEYVKPGGYFLMQVRINPGKGINDFKRSYQDIGENEKANYVVHSYRQLMAIIKNLRPRCSNVYGYGYWGKPAATAHTPFKKLIFGMVIIQKQMVDLRFPVPRKIRNEFDR